MKYVILAGGMGSRFSKEGVATPKPMVEIMGEPMIGRLIRILSKCGAEAINVAANPRMEGFIPYLESLQQQYPYLSIRPIITDNSYNSLKAGTDGLEGKFVAMTVDAIFPIEEFKSYVDKVAAMHDDEVLMGLTRYVDDESPLYARVNEQGEVIDYRYGGSPFEEGTIVSAGLYGLSSDAMKAVVETGYYPESLSDFQRTLAVKTAMKVRPYEFSCAFDVDNLHDLSEANRFLAE
ncbi:MAG: NDP-sugar synthase [Muribaculaceae bacterium]